MLNIPVEIKNLLKTNTATKNFRVTFPNGERADIINDNIVFESVRFTESVMSQNKFKLGLCESPVIEFEVFGIENIKDKKIECYYEIYCASTVDDAVYREDLDAYVYPIPLGVFYVDSCKKEAKMNMRRVVAYGEQAYFEWKIPDGTYFNTGGGSIDISAYLALVLQTSDVVDVTSIQDIQQSTIYTYRTTGIQINASFFSSDLPDRMIGEVVRNILPTDVFIDFASSSVSETSMTWRVNNVNAFLANNRKEIRSNFNSSLFTFDTVSKVKNVDSIRNFITEGFNQYVQEYECRDPLGLGVITHINYINDPNNPTYYTQPYAYDSNTSTTKKFTQDTKYDLCENFDIHIEYVWNNDKTEYLSPGSTDILSAISYVSSSNQYSYALANLINAWETVTGHTWKESGAVIESDWANGENNRITFGKKIDFTPFGYSSNNFQSLTREETQKYAENILETQGKLGRFNREGNFEAFTIDTATLVPNNTDLVPSESLVPNGADVDTIYPSEYETAWYDDELSLPYGACAANHKVSGTDTYTIVYADGYDADTDPSTYQIYDISNNDLVKEMTVEEITPILTTIITNLSNLRYMPSDIDMVGRPDIEAGDGIQVMSNSGAFNTYVLSRTTDGIQGLSDTITAK